MTWIATDPQRRTQHVVSFTGASEVDQKAMILSLAAFPCQIILPLRP